MARIDLRLRHLQPPLPIEKRVHVLLQYQTDLTRIESLGFQTTSVAGDVAAGSITSDRLDQLRRHEDVISIELSRSLKDELDASSVVIGLVDPATDHRAIPSFGAGALIGVIDSGFDLTHPCFCDDKGKTRIIGAWDQVNVDNVQGQPPKAFSYGVEYTQEAIDWDLANKRIVIVKNEKGGGAHGTYVAGIAAGNGAPHAIYKGVAPEAELILVAYKNDRPVGGSAFVIDAIAYIVSLAQAKGKPVVISLSQGDNLGAHDGTSLLERAIDNIVNQGRVLVVASAGNERGGPVSHHASGKVVEGHEFVLPFVLQDNRVIDGDTLELWYRSGDSFQIKLKTPSGWMSDTIPPGISTVIDFPFGTRALISSEINHASNSDNRIGIVLQKGDGWEGGVWQLLLEGQQIKQGDFDAWVDRPNDVTAFGFLDHQSENSTVTLPGNARGIITVGSFVSRPAGGKKSKEIKGSIEWGSSFGPTRDGRIKPDLVAPGALIVTPSMRANEACAPCYVPRRGTSLAAPHVTGAVALVWALWPQLPGSDICDALYATARSDEFTGKTPNMKCGYGKLDAQASYKRLSTMIEKGTKTMANAQVLELELGPQPKNESVEVAGMVVQIVVEDGNRVTITGTSGDNYYVGKLILTRKEGGDECWVCDVNGENCHWQKPCPFGN